MVERRRTINPHPLTDRSRRAFQTRVWEYYRTHGRDLPWRRVPVRKDGSHDPYRILVSEIMLQQTQVDRVIPKYRAFLRTFPSIRALARAPLADVLAVWQGLGYNRRAKFLKALAEEVVAHHGGRMPRTRAALETLPGIGPYTAAAVSVFAFNTPEVLIETNIRTVFIRHFFSDRKTPIHDAEILPYIEATMDRTDPRTWYAALMDYGAYLKRVHGNASRRSTHYTRQSKFAGSNRQLRGAIIRELTNAGNGLTAQTLARRVDRTEHDVATQLAQLTAEGFLQKRGRAYTLV